MTQARKSRQQKQRGAGRGLPGWAMLTIGLIIGLFVAFLVYLDDLQQPPNAAVEQGGSTAPATKNGNGGKSAQQSQGGEKKPNFEFYSILPDLEVVVPDKQKKTAGQASGKSEQEKAGGQETTPQPSTEHAFYLQAGSFQKESEADRMKAEISLLGLDVSIQNVTINGDHWHRVRIGPYTDPAHLRSAKKRLREHDIDYLVLRSKSSG